MTFTDAELDGLVEILKAYDGVSDNVTKIHLSRRVCTTAADAITHLRAQRREDAMQYLSDEGQIADRIEAAVKAERERCAKVANKMLVRSTFGTDAEISVVYSGFVAAAIMEEPK